MLYVRDLVPKKGRTPASQGDTQFRPLSRENWPPPITEVDQANRDQHRIQRLRDPGIRLASPVRHENYGDGLLNRPGLITGFTCMLVSVMVNFGWPASFNVSYFVGYCNPSKAFHAE